jgi:hypothetical protein
MNPRDTFTKEEQELVLIGSNAMHQVVQLNLYEEIKSIKSASASVGKELWFDGNSDEWIAGVIAGMHRALEVTQTIEIEK